MKTKHKTNKQQYAYQVIRSRILDGRYPPGHKLVIDQLARELQTSAIPVREAIRLLEADSLISFKPYSGAIVTPFDEQAYLETLSVLAVLEGFATAESSVHFPHEKLEGLREYTKLMEDALEHLDYSLFSNYNKEFHKLTYKYCTNQFLLEQIHTTWERLGTVRKQGSTMKPVRMKRSVTEHYQLIEMIERREDPKVIESYTRNHKLNTLKAFLEDSKQNTF
ncbi:MULTISPECIES: GntR family transcriptional regulator [Fictibacillus]|jgi:DNA-binding GntR family transcriptional regulator|nr:MULTISPECIES: GntR family transcriptional regulator [unclassified Fictibacillus]MBH0164663.1 GntR family transcriptional regulator [Fictibacillus sp. 7GRE50]MBH0172735.1 GntR family transcriptional regulator [Fictibacillus sp. 23RED33]